MYYQICNILCTVNTQHASRQDAIITISLYLAKCFGRKRPSSGELKTILRYSKNTTQWDPISFTLKLDKIWNFLLMIKATSNVADINQCPRLQILLLFCALLVSHS